MEKISILKKGEGPCLKKLNETLTAMGVQRQAYHGGSFNGNHTDKCQERLGKAKFKITM